MKMVKKILLGLAAATVAIGMISCADAAGAGKATGTKTNKTITVDATDKASKKLETAYRRYIKQLGSSEKVAEIETTITVNAQECILESTDAAGNPTYANFGFVFDMNKVWDNEKNSPKADTENEKYRDLVVFGFQPKKKRAYIEHYPNVNFKEELDTDEGSVGQKDEAIFGNGSWGNVTEGTDYTLEDGIYTLNIKIKQATKGKYDFYLGNRKLGSYQSSGKYVGTASENAAGYAIGAVGGYVNCPKGTKVVANYVTDSDTVTGKFEAEEIEE